MKLFHSIWSGFNAIGFSLRSQFRWTRKPYTEKAESKQHLFDHRDNRTYLLQREQELLSRYNLISLKSNSGALRYVETLTYLDFLDRMLSESSLSDSSLTLQWLDVGAKNWKYVESMYRWLEKTHDDFSLTGIEVDGYRLYRDFYRRCDYAGTFIRNLPKARYLVEDVLNHREQYDVVTCFLPFILLEPCLHWGLPSRMFSPKKFLRHLFSLIKENGVLIIINQGENEFQAQEILFEEMKKVSTLSFEIEWKGKLPDSFMEYVHSRFGWRCKKLPSDKL
ncbi:MAG: hypothetical protein FJ218_07835 [Ignavibacteria bacterium]|nr:hypothetical protein [Ignavibacteria bacterium]